MEPQFNILSSFKSPSMSSKSVLITGCSAGGIGHALAIAFQKRGFTVFATARSIKKMQDLASLSNVHLISLDVTSSASIDAAAAEVSAKTNGKLDVLVNNAGAQFIMPALDVDIAAAKAFFDVNYWATLEMVQRFSSMLIAANACVVNVSSSAGVATLPFQSTSINYALSRCTARYIDSSDRSVQCFEGRHDYTI
jgi:1-acylglycerone phosphate reductase